METAEAISAIRSNWPDERYTMLREALTKAIAALEAMEAGQPDVQQLKAEIAAMATELECTLYEKFDSGMYHALRGRLRQLSAV